MVLSSASTLEDALDQYSDNLLWEGNATKALNALEAIRWLLINRSKVQEKDGIKMDFESLSEEKKQLESFVSTAVTGSRVSFTRGRALF